eukprot:gene3861-4118_t
MQVALHSSAFSSGKLLHKTCRRRCVVARAEATVIPSGFSKIEPKGDRVLVKVADQEEKTRGGILLPASAQKRPTSGTQQQHSSSRWQAGDCRECRGSHPISFLPMSPGWHQVVQH